MTTVDSEIIMQGNNDAWFTANASVIYPANIQIFHIDGRYKFSDGITTLSALPFLGALGYTPEDIANKQNSLAVDGTGNKYVTVDAVNAGLSNYGNGFKPIYSGFWRTIDFINAPAAGATAYNGAVFWIPYLIGRTHNVTGIGIEIVTPQAGSNIRLALYSDLNGAPNILIEDSGNIPSTTSGLKSYTFSTVRTLDQANQIAWLGLQVSIATVKIRNAASSVTSIYVNATGVRPSTPYQTQAFGAFPATAIPIFPPANNVPLICLKVQ